METVQNHHGDDNHHSLEANEQPLLADQWPCPPLTQLHDSVNGANEDAERGDGESCEEAAKLDARAEIGESGLKGSGVLKFRALESTEGEVDTDSLLMSLARSWYMRKKERNEP